MKKGIVALSLAAMLLFQASSAEALSCVTTDMYLDGVMGDEATQIFIGTATEVKDNTQVVTVTKALQDWVAPKVWVNHPYDKDWQYLCSNGPAPEGKSTVFFTTLDQYGSYSVVQTLSADLPLAKDFIEKIEKEEISAGITEATPVERADEVRLSIGNLIKALINMLNELSFWQSSVTR